MATGIFSREMGRKLATLKQLREKSDYDDFYIASREKAVEQVETARMVLNEIQDYLSQQKIE